ncbi:hypothetical protein [Streptomyces sp. NPDC049040]|uniref:hypothetical protein n=1 Tax=Streptomyces sp. NPDC049040 TaxID=3365593 RepID=UPI0037154851
MRGGSEPGTKRKPTDVERLVGKAAAGDESDPRWSALLRVLTAAARGAAVDPEQEQAAVIAFRAAASARSDRSDRPARGRRARRRRRPAGSARVLAGGLAAVFAICGVAVAAGSGMLPPRGHTAHSAAPPDLAARTAAPAPTGAPTDTARPAPIAPDRATPPPPAATATATATGAPPPRPGHTRAAGPRALKPAAVRALCRVYAAAVRKGRAPAPQLTARLQWEAGGRQRITAYCHALLSAASGTATK